MDDLDDEESVRFKHLGNTFKHYIAIADVTKAYDNVDLDILDRMVMGLNPPPDVVQEWKQELYDLRELYFNIGSFTIKRTNGLPQGSELAPLLFNFFISHILKSEEFYRIVELFEIDVYVYADNWLISCAYKDNIITAIP